MTDSESTRTPSQSKSTALQGKTVVKIASSFVNLSGDAAGAFTGAQDNKDMAGYGAGQKRNGFCQRDRSFLGASTCSCGIESDRREAQLFAAIHAELGNESRTLMLKLTDQVLPIGTAGPGVTPICIPLNIICHSLASRVHLHRIHHDRLT